MRFIGLIVFLFAAATSFGQDSAKVKRDGPPPVTLRGYIKNLQSVSHAPQADLTALSNLIHNRLNFRWYATEGLTFGLEQRTRIFVGDDVRLNPLLTEQLEMDPGIVDASWLIWSSNSAAMHTRLERLWIDYAANTWEARIGRQRINWGMHLVWNPNDLFNTFAFLDFDYEEMPGADAARVIFYPGTQVIELAYSPDFRNQNQHIAAARYGFNFGSYDMQVIGGWRYDQAVVGLGWAGNLGNASLKGEAAWFHPVLDGAPETEGFTAAVSVDHTFEKPVYVHAAYLYSSRGSNEELNAEDLLGFNPLAVPSPDRLMLSQHSMLGQAVWTATPLLNVSGTVIYGPGPDMLIVFPGVGYSIADNWDLLLNAQFFWASGFDQEGLTNLADVVFLRTKWSF